MPSAPYTSPLAEALAPDVVDRLVRYARVDTQSRRDREQSPSTPGQRVLAELLAGELREIGLADAAVDDDGYVMATLPGTVQGAPVVGLLAHMDVSPDAPGAGVEPLVHRDYPAGRSPSPAAARSSTPRACRSSACASATTW